MELFLGLLVLIIGYAWGQSSQQKKQQKQARSAPPAETAMLNNQHWGLLWGQLAEFQRLHHQKQLSTESWLQVVQKLFEHDLPHHQLRTWLRSQPNYAIWQHREVLQQRLELLQVQGLIAPEELERCQQNLAQVLPYWEDTSTAAAVSAAASPKTSQLQIIVETPSDFAPAPGFQAAAQAEPLSDAAHDFLAAQQPKDLLSRLLDLLGLFTTGRWANLVIGLGVVSVVVSSLPLIQEMSSATLIYAVMLMYTLGLLGAGLGLNRRIPWTGQVLTIVSLLILPLDYASVLTLDLAQGLDLAIHWLALLGLPAVAWLALRSLLGRVDLLFLLALTGLGWSSGLLRGAQGLLNSQADAFALFCVTLSMVLMALGSQRVIKQFWVLEGQASDQQPERSEKHTLHHNWLSSFGLLAYLFISALMLPAIYALPWPWIGLTLCCGAGVLAWSASRLRALLHLSLPLPWPAPAKHWLQGLELSCCALMLLAVSLAWGRADVLSLICAVAAMLSLWLSAAYPQQTQRWGGYSLSALLGSGGLLLLSADWTPDGQSLLLAGCSLTLVIWGLTGKKNSWRQDAFHQLALLSTAAAWMQIGRFDDWSLQTLAALAILGFIYLRYAVFSQRNLFAYVGIVVSAITAFSVLSVWKPEMEFADYRLYAMGLAWLLLGLGFVIQKLTPQRQAPVLVSALPIADEQRASFWQRLNAERFQPFHFQQRFLKPYPFLFSEPLYNIALLITTVTLLTDLDSLGLTLLGTAFYAAIFLIYPARIWIYLVIMAISDSILDLSGDLLPARYQSWSLVMLGLGWFFVGTLIEELLEARDRKHPDAHHEQQKKFAKPFFHGAILSNVLLLRYFFGDLQNVFSESGWLKITREATPMLLTSVFYVLKMRVYVSKLWLYPGIITATLGLYFGLTGFLPLESPLLVLTAIAFVWLGLSRYLDRHQGIQAWWQELIAHRLPQLDPNSHFAKVHTHNLSSPLWTFGLITACCSLLFSSLLIPYQPLELANEFEIALLKHSSPGLLYVLQSLNFLLLALFFLLSQPLKSRLLWLQGMIMLSLSLGACWLVQELSRLQQLHLVFSSLTLIWTGGWAVFRSRCPGDTQLVLARGTLLLSGISLGFLPFSSSSSLLVLSTSCLLLSWLLRLALTQQPWHLYAIIANLLFTAEIVFRGQAGIPGSNWQQGFISPLLLSPLVLGLWFQARRFQTSFNKHFEYLNAGLLTIHLLGLLNMYLLASEASEPQLYLQLLLGTWAAIWGSAAYLLSTTQASKWLYGLLAYAALLAGILLHFSHHSLWLLLACPWLFYGLFRKTRQQAFQWAALLTPICLSFWMFLLAPAFESGWGVLWKNLPFMAWVLFYFQAGKGRAAHSRYWWLAAGWLNFSWVYMLLTGIQVLQQHLFSAVVGLTLLWQALFLLPALSGLVLAYRVLNKQPDRNQLFYLSQTVLLLIPLFTWLAFADPETLLEQSLSWFAVFEFALLLGLLALASVRLRLRALLKMVLFTLALLLTGAVLYILLKGHWSLRWSLFIATGFLLIFGGNLLQSRQQELRLQLERLQLYLLTWT